MFSQEIMKLWTSGRSGPCFKNYGTYISVHQLAVVFHLIGAVLVWHVTLLCILVNVWGQFLTLKNAKYRIFDRSPLLSNGESHGLYYLWLFDYYITNPRTEIIWKMFWILMLQSSTIQNLQSLNQKKKKILRKTFFVFHTKTSVLYISTPLQQLTTE